MKNHRKFFPEPIQNPPEIHAKSKKFEQKTKKIDKISHDDLRCAKNAKKMRKNAKKWPKTSPKDVQQGGPRPWDFSKLRPRGVQVASKRSKRRPRGAQDSPRASQERSKSGQERPQSTQERPKSRQERPESDRNPPGDAQCASRGTFLMLCHATQDFWGSFQSWSPPYLRAGPLPVVNPMSFLGLQRPPSTGFLQTLRLDLKTKFCAQEWPKEGPSRPQTFPNGAQD